MNNTTELVFVLDRSGSMHPLVADTIGGFNSLLEKQRGQEGLCLVTTVLFDDRADTVHDRLPLDRVAPMTTDVYFPRGTTALLDTLGDTIGHIRSIHKYARPEDVPSHTLFVIITDGMENASRRYGAEQIKAMITRQKQEHGWEFLFLASNIDAVGTAARYGIDAERAVNCRADGQATALQYDAVTKAVSAMREGCPLSADWRAKLDDDFQHRPMNS